MDLKKIAGLVIILGVLVQLLWGFLGNGWNRSWIATSVAVFIAIFLYILDNNKEKK
jgi:hypothetical protein